MNSKQKSDNTEQNCKLSTEICELEKQIDKKVYALYGLTKEEIAVVENS